MIKVYEIVPHEQKLRNVRLLKCRKGKSMINVA